MKGASLKQIKSETFLASFVGDTSNQTISINFPVVAYINAHRLIVGDDNDSNK